MKRKIVIPVIAVVAIVGTFSVATILGHQSSKDVNTTQYLKSNQKDDTKEEKLKELEKQKREIEQTNNNSKDDLDKEKNLSEQIIEQEQELGIADSKEKFETSLNTLTAVVQDTQRELDRNGVPVELIDRAKARVKKLGKITEKYEKRSKDKNLDENDYEKLYKEMSKASNDIIVSLDKEFPFQ